MTSWLRSTGVAREPPLRVAVTLVTVTGHLWWALPPMIWPASPPCDADTMPHVNLLSPIGRVMAPVTAWLRDCWHRKDVPVSLRIAPPDEARPPVPAAYMPLYTYLDRRYAATVVLTFEQIEALLGFAPPSPAFADAEWWTGPCGANDRHTAAWIAARRRATPQLSARIVAFERLP
jgi:hypothetical protein